MQPSERETAQATLGLAPNGWPARRLQGFRAGETWALREVYDAHVKEVLVLLRGGFSFRSGGQNHRFVGYRTPSEVHDSLHDTFVLAFAPRARLNYDGLRPYGAYVRRIAQNVVLREFRSSARTFVSTDVGVLDEQVVVASEHHEPPPAADAALVRDEIRVAVQRFMAQLSLNDRQLVTLRFEQGLSQRDAAERLGQTRQRIRTREAQLRRKLFSTLERDGLAPRVDAAIWAVVVACCWEGVL